MKTIFSTVVFAASIQTGSASSSKNGHDIEVHLRGHKKHFSPIFLDDLQIRNSEDASSENFVATTTVVSEDTTTHSPIQLIAGMDDALFLGYSVSNAGDVNGDGIDDVIVGAPKKTFSDEIQEVGAAFIVFGRDGALPELNDVDLLDGTNGFALYGSHVNDQVGYSVSNAGDLNGDGIADVIIGAPGADGFDMPGSGQAYVIFGRSDDTFPAVIDLASIDGSNGFIVQGYSIQDFLGASVSGAGDVNGDGIDDIVVGAPNAGNNVESTNGGEAYVIFGSVSGFPPVVFVTDLDGSNGFALSSEGDEDVFGRSVAHAGDVNGDGIDDILVSAIQARNSKSDQAGAVYVIYGSRTPFEGSFEVSALNGYNGYKISGISEFDEFGYALSAVGDINGDEIDDFAVGCPRCRPSGGNFYAGAAFVFHGTEEAPAEVDAASSASIIVTGQETFEGVGEDVAAAGDVNGDGIPDIMIGAGRALADEKNALVYILYGTIVDDSLPRFIKAKSIDSTRGLSIPMFDSNFQGVNDRVISISMAGDLNHDGLTDLIVGLPNVKDVDGSVEGQIKIILGHK